MENKDVVKTPKGKQLSEIYYINDELGIRTDNSNIILVKRTIVQSGDKQGEEKISNIGYYSTYEGLLYGLIRKEMVKTEDLTELNDVVNRIEILLKDAVKAVISHKCATIK